MNALILAATMGKLREQRRSLHTEEMHRSSLVQRKTPLMMIAVQVVIWSWLPISLAAVATQATGHDTGSLGQFLVPGSAAASIIACVWLFLQRMAKAGEETKTQIQLIVEAHERAVKVLSESIGRNTDGMRFLAEKVISECRNPKKNHEEE